jgi:hypothetical protein
VGEKGKMAKMDIDPKFAEASNSLAASILTKLY